MVQRTFEPAAAKAKRVHRPEGANAQEPAWMKRGVIIKTIINGFTFDGSTKDPIQKAVRDSLIAFMAATAQAHEGSPAGVYRLRQGKRRHRLPWA